MTYDILEDCFGDKGELCSGWDQFNDFGSRLDLNRWCWRAAAAGWNGRRPVNRAGRSTPLRIIQVAKKIVEEIAKYALSFALIHK